MIWEVVVLGKQCSFERRFSNYLKKKQLTRLILDLKESVADPFFRTETNFSVNLQENEEFLSSFKCALLTRTAIYLIFSCFRMKNDRDTRSTSPLEENKNVKNTEDTNKKLKNFQNAIKIGPSKE